MSESTADSAATNALPSSRAFVVQFTAAPDVPQRRIAGRIEHIATGQALHFQNLQQLIAFVDDTLRR